MDNTLPIGGAGDRPISIKAAALSYEKNENSGEKTLTIGESGLTEEEFSKIDYGGTGTIKMKDYMNYLSKIINDPADDSAGPDSSSGGIRNNSFV